MIDHFYDKLIRVCDFPIQNPFFERITTERKKEILDFILLFGNQGKITKEDCKNYIIQKFILNWNCINCKRIRENIHITYGK